MTTRVAACLERDGEKFLPTHYAQGLWNAKSIHGMVIAGLLGRALELEHADSAFQFTRLTVELFRAAPMVPLEVHTERVRDSHRLRVAHGIVTADGVEVARGQGVILRKGESPPDDGWRPDGWLVPSPDELPTPIDTHLWDLRPIPDAAGTIKQRRSWLRDSRLLVANEELTPFVRCAFAVDFTNPLSNGSPDGLHFINVDLALYLHRELVGEWIGFEVASHQSSEGVAVGETTLYDANGPIGKSLVCALSNGRMGT